MNRCPVFWMDRDTWLKVLWSQMAFTSCPLAAHPEWQVHRCVTANRCWGTDAGLTGITQRHPKSWVGCPEAGPASQKAAATLTCSAPATHWCGGPPGEKRFVSSLVCKPQCQRARVSLGTNEHCHWGVGSKSPDGTTLTFASAFPVGFVVLGARQVEPAPPPACFNSALYPDWASQLLRTLTEPIQGQPVKTQWALRISFPASASRTPCRDGALCLTLLTLSAGDLAFPPKPGSPLFSCPHLYARPQLHRMALSAAVFLFFSLAVWYTQVSTTSVQKMTVSSTLLP